MMAADVQAPECWARAKWLYACLLTILFNPGLRAATSLLYR